MVLIRHATYLATACLHRCQRCIAKLEAVPAKTYVFRNGNFDNMMCRGMCTNRHINMCRGMCINRRIEMCLGMSINRHIDICRDMSINRHINMCLGMSINRLIEVCKQEGSASCLCHQASVESP